MSILCAQGCDKSPYMGMSMGNQSLTISYVLIPTHVGSEMHESDMSGLSRGVREPDIAGLWWQRRPRRAYSVYVI